MDATFPLWLTTLASLSLLLAAICSIVIIVDEIRHPQKMWIMNLVWPLTALFGSVVWLAAYWAWGAAQLVTEQRSGQATVSCIGVKGSQSLRGRMHTR
jgi:hypothetical protein